MSAISSPGIDRWTSELHSWLDGAAQEAGFALAGVVPVLGYRNSTDAQRFSDWVEQGRAGEMEYLKRRNESGTLLRGSVATAFPWARSVIVCALDYSSGTARSIDPAPNSVGWIARYAWSGHVASGQLQPTDYHDDMHARLRRIESGLLEQVSGETRCYVDTGPLIERAVAAQAGIGWIGKNTCLIHQELGSWLLLGVIITSLPLEDAGETLRVEKSDISFTIPAVDRCGTCTRCIDACPTEALLGSRLPTGPREMDASRCIAYLTIEKKGEIPEELRASMGRNVFGCDICQEVCPWNVKAAATRDSAQKQREQDSGRMQPRAELINPDLEGLAAMDSREFNRQFRGSPLERTGRKRLLRNVAIAMGNSGEQRFLPALEGLTQNYPGEHPNDIAIRDAAVWAREQLLATAVKGGMRAQDTAPTAAQATANSSASLE